MKNKKLDENQAELILRSILEQEPESKYIKIDWHSFRQIHPNKYVFQLIFNKLSLNLIQKLESSPLIESVTFFPKIGGLGTGVNLVFKLHIIFKGF